MPGAYPEDYAGIHAQETAIEDARTIKDELDVTWTGYLRRATVALEDE